MNKFFFNVNTFVVLVLILQFYQIRTVNQIIQQSFLNGTWYPKTKKDIINQLRYFSKNIPPNIKFSNVKAIIVPHAGYKYSGITASSAYQYLPHKNINKIIILAPSHNKNINGISLPPYTIYETPLGKIHVNQPIINQLRKNPYFLGDPSVHKSEHSIEIQLPFIQYYFKNITIIPLIVGQLDDTQRKKIGEELSSIIDDKTLIIISSDFMHYGKNYNFEPFSPKENTLLNRIQQSNSKAIEAISKSSYDQFINTLTKYPNTICGEEPIKLFLFMIKKGFLPSLYTHVTDYKTSKNNINPLLTPEEGIVAYAGLILTDKPTNDNLSNIFTYFEKQSLLKYAYDIIKNHIALPENKINENILIPILSSSMHIPVGAFVTIYKTINGKKELRGCIGHLKSTKSLYETIKEVSKSAATEDPRFNPLTNEELSTISIEITILGNKKAISSINEIELGKHGIILQHKSSSALFLPQVPLEFKWSLEKTLEELSQKAGLSKNAWQDKETKFFIFEGLIL